MTQYKKPAGFTLVELMLAMAFVGILLVAIAALAIHVMGTYTKGITIREVNQSGRTITEDIQRAIASSVPFKVEPAKTGASTDEADSKYVTRPGGGRLCTGTYTYAWNYGDTQQLSGATATNVYNVYEDSDDIIRMVKVDDAGGALCTDTSQAIKHAEAKELLSEGDRDLALHAFSVEQGARHDASGQALYAIDMVLGTLNDREQLIAGSANCLPPSEGNGSEDFCAINQFNIIARSGNRSGSL